MDYEKELSEAVAFIDAARTALDHAELVLAGSLSHQRPLEKLDAGQCMTVVAIRNLDWCAQGVKKVAEHMQREKADGASVDGVSPGRTVVSESQVGCDSIPESTASTRKH